jgi:predicted ATPase
MSLNQITAGVNRDDKRELPMIEMIQASNFRCLRNIRQEIGPFQVLVGPNASGKTTFIDAIRFLSIMVRKGIDAAVGEFSKGDFSDLLWNGEGDYFELAVEAAIPDELRSKTVIENEWQRIRYEVQIGTDPDGRPAILQDRGSLIRLEPVTKMRQPPLFPMAASPVETIISHSGGPGSRKIFGKSRTGNDSFNSEKDKRAGKGWIHSLKTGSQTPSLSSIPADEDKFAIAIWLKTLLAEGIQHFVLNSASIREMSKPGQGTTFLPDGSNLPWVAEDLKTKHRKCFQAWLRHVQTALPQIADIEIRERQDIRHKYMMVRYQGMAHPVPSWLVSDGTLRLLALTLPAFIPGLKGVFLIEEPENGIHPKATETMFQSLSSMHDAQVLMCTHSPIVLSVCDPHQILCFATDNGITDIVRGDRHPALANWQGDPNLSVLFASGVLG